MANNVKKAEKETIRFKKGMAVDMNNSAIGRRFIAPVGNYPFVPTVDNDGTIQLTKIVTDKGKDVFLLSGIVTVNGKERKAEIAVTDEQVLNDAFDVIEAKTYLLVNVTKGKDGQYYSRLCDAFETLMFIEQLIEETEELKAKATIEA